MDAAEIESRRQDAEREVRRGSFQTAIATYEALVREAPGDAALAERLEALRGLLQPMETASAKAAAGGASVGAPEAKSDVQKGEEAANRGDLPAAIAAYRRIVAAEPGNDLARERLEELVRQAQAAGLGAPQPAAARPPVAPQPAAVPPAAKRPPPDPVVLLEGLLARVRSRRRRA